MFEMKIFSTIGDYILLDDLSLLFELYYKAYILCWCRPGLQCRQKYSQSNLCFEELINKYLFIITLNSQGENAHRISYNVPYAQWRTFVSLPKQLLFIDCEHVSGAYTPSHALTTLTVKGSSSTPL